jgi:ABC-type cobalamin/Fe3+-siderophores transport system ATPase subunit
MVVEFGEGGTAASIPFADLSDGEKCFVICAIVIAANQVYGPLICYWDEPDNYLAPDEVAHVTMALRRAFQSKGQFIATSHNIDAISRFSDENTIMLHRRSHADPTVIYSLDSLRIDGSLTDALLSGGLVPA